MRAVFARSVLPVVATLATAVAAEPIKTAFGHVPPLSYRTPDGRPAGFTVDVLNEAARRADLILQWVPAGPSREIERALRAGTLDLVPGAMVTPERQRLFYLSDPWWFAELSLLARAGNGHLGSGLTGKRLALGSPIYHFLAEKEFPKATEMPFVNAFEAAAAVCRGEADAALMMHMEVHEIFLARPDVCRDVAVETVDTNATMEIAIMARPGAAGFAARLRRQIDEMALDGTLARMAARHPPMPASGVLRLGDNVRARYQRRLWYALALLAGLCFAGGAWLIFDLRRDVAARKRAQADLQASQARLERAHGMASLGDWELDLASGRVDLSDVARDLFCPARSNPRTGFDLFLDCAAPEEVNRVRAALDRAAAGDVIELDYVINAGARGRRHIRQRAEPVRNGESVIALVGIIQDITEHKELEAQFRQAQKIESLGRLAGGVAHDFNNLLTVINGYTDVLLSQLPEYEPAHDAAREVRKAGDRAAVLTKQLLTFSRRQQTERSEIDLNDVVAEVEKMLGRLVGDDVAIVTDLAPAGGFIYADAGEICQLLTNFVVNARDAMPNGGSIRIKTQRVMLDPAAAQQRGVAAGPYVLLAVSDTGCGMDAETTSRIFEPFFTTKDKGKGTGLGLATVWGIVRQSNGSIEVESELGQGATFRVYFPRSTEPGINVKAPDAQPASVRGSEQILVVEDEPALRRLVATTLRSSGYRTVEAANGEEALQAVSNQADPDLLITDVSMPGMSGIELARRVKAARPSVRVLLISGDSHVSETGAECGFRMLQKPFTPGVLAASVRAVLDGRSDPERRRSAGQ